jgi:hypothetical protein
LIQKYQALGLILPLPKQPKYKTNLVELIFEALRQIARKNHRYSLMLLVTYAKISVIKRRRMGNQSNVQTGFFQMS